VARSRWRTTAGGRALVRTGAALRGVPAALGTATLQMPGRLLIAPPDLRTHDPTVAEDILAGFYVAAGKVVQAQGQSPFTIAPPSPQWESALNGFGWLRHMRATDNPMARQTSRTLVEDFLKLRSNKRGAAWAAPVAARRLLSFVSAAPFLLEGANLTFYRRFLRSLGQHARYLLAGLSGSFAAEERFLPAISICALALSSDAKPRLTRLAMRALMTEIRRCILPDGGHVNRSPRAIVEVLLDLLPLRHLLLSKNLATPELLQVAIERMLGMLRLLRFGDGTLGLFHGTGYMPADSLAIVSRYSQGPTQTPLRARESGFERILGGPLILLVDVGRPPPFAFSRGAHASALAFELADGPCKMIVNCGAPAVGTASAREASRHTAAHSTLVIADTSSCRFERAVGRNVPPPAIIERPVGPNVLRELDDAGTRLTAAHSGYARRFGYLHERGIAVASDGSIVHGLDALIDADPKKPAGAVAYALRFHLHPGVAAKLGPDGGSVTLTLASGASWRFEVAGHRILLEDSIYYAAPDGAGRTRQIVVEQHSSTSREIGWRFTRLTQAQIQLVPTMESTPVRPMSPVPAS